MNMWILNYFLEDLFEPSMGDVTPNNEYVICNLLLVAISPSEN